MAFKYKQKCVRCRKNYVTVTWKNRFPICYGCQQKEMQGEVKDPKMQKLFNIPEEFFKGNAFLRSIKINYLKYDTLTDKQIETFKKAVAKMKKDLREKAKGNGKKEIEIKEEN